MDSFERSLQLRILQSQLGPRRIDTSVLLDSMDEPAPRINCAAIYPRFDSKPKSKATPTTERESPGAAA
jgi:hypothetical protein